MNNKYTSVSNPTRFWPKLVLAGLLAVGTTAAAHAQALNYSVANTQNVPGTYTDLGATGTVLATANTDDANSAAIPIGFNFAYNGATMDRFILNTNGFVKLGDATSMTAPTVGLYTATAQSNSGGTLLGTAATDVNLLSPFNFDLLAGTSPAEYRMATTGTAPNRVCTIQWKNVADKAIAGTTGGTVVPNQYANMSFQVKLYETTNIIEFVFGAATPAAAANDNFKYAQCGIKGSGNLPEQIIRLTKGSVTPWSAATASAGAVTSGMTGAFNFRQSVPPDNGRTFRFVPQVANDAAVQVIYAYGKLLVPAGQPTTLQALVSNPGTATLTNVSVTMTITGANTVTTPAQVVPSLAAGATSIVSFSNVALPNAGNNTITVSVPSDGNNFNNTQTLVMVTDPTTTSYIYPGIPQTSSYGFAPGATAFTSAFAARFTLTTPRRATAVQAAIGNDANLVGTTVFGVLANSTTGAILARSPDYVLTAADLNTLRTFTLSTTPVLPTGDFLAGLAQVVPANATGVFPMGFQTENPARPNTFFSFSVTTPGPPNDATANNARYMLEVVTSAVQGTSAALDRAVSVYPNPSATGVVTMAVRGAKASGPLSVRVTNLLGQTVYTASLKDNFANELDLSALASGVYVLKVQTGAEYTVRQLSLTK